jgi:hypothetical protein
VRQLQLELTYINDPNISPDAARASVDNILDIIEIVQSDPNLSDMATQGGISGFTPLPDAANPAPTHLENDVQAVFTANFIAQSNSLGQQAIDLVGSGDTKAIATLIDNLKAFEKFVAEFDAAQGGNALLDAAGALGAEVAAMIKGLQTGDATLVTAAADQMHGNAADVGGNTVPVTGGTYNADGVTVAEVLGTPTAETPPVAETPAAAAAPDVHQVAAPTVTVEQTALATADVGVESTDHPHSACPNWRIIYITRGDSGGAARPPAFPDVPGMLEADTSGQERVRRSGSRGGRTEDLFIGLRPQRTIFRRWPQRRLWGPSLVRQRHRRLAKSARLLFGK